LSTDDAGTAALFLLLSALSGNTEEAPEKTDRETADCFTIGERVSDRDIYDRWRYYV
jgi:hypothetical protein